MIPAAEPTNSDRRATGGAVRARSATPASSATQELRIQGEAAEFGTDIGLGGASVDWDLQLIEGTTVIHTTALAEDITTEPPGTAIDETLSDAVYDLIGNHANLRIRMRGARATDSETDTDVNMAVNYVRLVYAPHT